MTNNYNVHDKYYQMLNLLKYLINKREYEWILNTNYFTKINKLTVNKENCIKAFDNNIFTTDQTIDSVKKGIPFREAYKKVAKNLTKIQKIDPITNIQSKKNIGATGNLGLNKLKLQLNKIKSNVSKQENDFKLIVKSLVG